MIASVARESGRSFESVASDSYALTLYAHLHNQDIDYQKSLLREEEAITQAEMIAVAFHEPKKLQQYRNSWRTRAFPIAEDIESLRERLTREADGLIEGYKRSKQSMVS